MSSIVTVCIPVFERYNFFENAVNSIKNQTVKCKILVCDNASSHSRFSDFCTNNNIDYYRNESNIGMFGNWNKCSELCKTDFFMILSDDDYLEPNYIETFLNVYKNNNHIDIFYSDFKIIDYHTNIYVNHSHLIPFGLFSDTNQILEYGVKYGLSFPVFTSVIRKSIFTGFESKFHTSADWLWMYEKLRILNIYGANETLVVRGSHSLNDTKLGETLIRCIFAISFIYEEYLEKIYVQKISLRLKSKLRAFSALVNLHAYYDRNSIVKILNDPNNKYKSIFLKYKWLSNLPVFVLKILNKTLTKRYFG
jgi:hypothetical protein